jgi:Holliday junction resolvasome RuvABC ATP-dependent DNA helicase subunit
MTDPLGPAGLDEFYGQLPLLERLAVLVEAADAGLTLPHMLFAGPTGTGRTALAHVLATWVGAPLYVVTDTKQLVATQGAILFIPDLHDAPRALRSKLLGMLRLDDPGFTVIATASEAHKIDGLLFGRFLVPAWTPYTPADMAAITESMAAKSGTILSDATLAGMARAAAGTPGAARTLVVAAQALTLADHGDQPTLEAILSQAGFAADGLTDAHLAYLDALRALGGNASSATVALVLARHPEVCRALATPLLVDGFIDRAGAGWQLTRLGYERLASTREAAA